MAYRRSRRVLIAGQPAWCVPCLCFVAVMLMFIDTKWGEEAMLASVISYAVFYGGFGQMVAGVFEVGVVDAFVNR